MKRMNGQAVDKNISNANVASPKIAFIYAQVTAVRKLELVFPLLFAQNKAD